MALKLKGGSEVILILFAQDGANIVDGLQTHLSSDKYMFNVVSSEVNDTTSDVMAAQGILLVTPDMMDMLEPRHADKINRSFRMCAAKTALVFDQAEECDDYTTRNKLESTLQDYGKWHILSMGKTPSDIKLTLLRIVEITEKSNDDTLPLVCLTKFQLHPKRIWTDSDEVFVTFKKQKIEGNVEVKLKNQFGGEKIVTAKILNEMTSSFKPTGMPNGKTKVEVLVDGRSHGMLVLEICSKMELLSTILRDVMNPLDLLCSSLYCNDRQSLDLELQDILTNGDAKFNPLSGLDFSTLKVSDLNSRVEFPTLLHLGAKLGLESFCKAILNINGCSATKLVKNKDGRTPSMLASLAGFIDLAAELCVPVEGNDVQENSMQNESEKVRTPLQDRLLSEHPISNIHLTGNSSIPYDPYMTMGGAHVEVFGTESKSVPPQLPPRRRKSRVDSTNKDVTVIMRRSGRVDSSYGSADSIPERELSECWTRRMTMAKDDDLPMSFVDEITKL